MKEKASFTNYRFFQKILLRPCTGETHDVVVLDELWRLLLFTLRRLTRLALVSNSSTLFFKVLTLPSSVLIFWRWPVKLFSKVLTFKRRPSTRVWSFWLWSLSSRIFMKKAPSVFSTSSKDLMSLFGTSCFQKSLIHSGVCMVDTKEWSPYLDANGLRCKNRIEQIWTMNHNAIRTKRTLTSAKETDWRGCRYWKVNSLLGFITDTKFVRRTSWVSRPRRPETPVRKGGIEPLTCGSAKSAFFPFGRVASKGFSIRRVWVEHVCYQWWNMCATSGGTCVLPVVELVCYQWCFWRTRWPKPFKS